MEQCCIDNLINPNDVGESSNYIISFIGELGTGLLNIIMPISIFLFMILIIGGTMALISWLHKLNKWKKIYLKQYL